MGMEGGVRPRFRDGIALHTSIPLETAHALRSRWRAEIASVHVRRSGCVGDSLIVNRRKPITYRVFRYLNDGLRVSLHKFDPCARHEAYPHPHPWPGRVHHTGRLRTGCGLDSRRIWNRATRSP